MSFASDENSKEFAESEDGEEELATTPASSGLTKIFKVCKVPRQNLMLMRNKIPKVFSVRKFKSFREKESSPTHKDFSDDEDCSQQKRTVREIYKIERFSHLRKRPSERSLFLSRVNSRVSNDYPEKVIFKIEKIQKNLVKPFALKRYPNKKKICDAVSYSTKRSSRNSSKQKFPLSESAPQALVEPLNVVKVEHEDTPLKMNHLSYQHENKLVELAHNDDFKKEIQLFKFQEQLEEIDVAKALINHENMKQEMVSLDYYHDHEIDELEIEKPLNHTFLSHAKPNFRARSLSG